MGKSGGLELRWAQACSVTGMEGSRAWGWTGVGLVRGQRHSSHILWGLEGQGSAFGKCEAKEWSDTSCTSKPPPCLPRGDWIMAAWGQEQGATRDCWHKPSKRWRVDEAGWEWGRRETNALGIQFGDKVRILWQRYNIAQGSCLFLIFSWNGCFLGHINKFTYWLNKNVVKAN